MGDKQFPSGILTFLFSDIQGSTPLWEKDPEGMSQALELHNAALRRAVAAYDGRVFKIIGDEFQVMFSNPGQAICAAIAGQHNLTETTWSHIGPLRVRMGIHTGPAQWEGLDYAVSHTFNRTARIMSCGHGGQILISQDAVDALNEELPAGASLQDMGRVRLKGMTAREHLYQVNAPGLIHEFPALKTIGGGAPPAAHNLPEPAAPFVGRQQELRDLGRLFAQDGTRLVTITGAGGMGKTRLALEYAWRRRGQYASGVHFISLAPLGDPQQILPAAAQVVGLQFKGEREPQEQLLRYLRSWQALLIFDNFEHLRGGAALLSRIVEGVPQIDLLATSRERLGLTCESLFALDGLSLPLNGEGREQLPTADAVRMFQTYARRVRPEYELSAVDWPAVVQLCRLVEGMPLAIELAAAWTRTMSPSEILEELQADLQILERESPDVPSRQRSMQASFDYSWRLLSKAEQEVLMKLSVFRGGCSREAAQEVAGAPIRTLGSLVDKSMLRRDPESGRYQMHELLRQMAEGRLRASGLTRDVVQAHASYYLAIFQQAAGQVAGEQGQAAFQLLFVHELDNCRAAMRRSLTLSQAEITLQLALMLYREGDLLWSEAVRWLEQSLEAGGELLPAALRAEAMLWLARTNLQNHVGRIDTAYWANEAANALAIYEELGDLRGTAHALHVLGFAYFGNDFELANAYYRQAIAAYERLGEEPISSLTQLAWVQLFDGRLLEARALYQRIADISRRTGNEMRLVMMRTQLAQIDYYEGHLYKAKVDLQQALAFRSSEGRPISEGNRFLAQGTLLDIALAEGDLDRARHLVQERLTYIRRHDAIGVLIFFYHQIGLWQHLLGHEREAAFWVGCYKARRDAADQPVEKLERPRLAALIKDLRSALGEEIYQAAFQEGCNAGIDDALDRGFDLL